MSVVAFRTETGLRFFEIEDDDNIRQMHDKLVELKAKQVSGIRYAFCITVSDETQTVEMRCTDVWVEHRLLRRYGF